MDALINTAQCRTAAHEALQRCEWGKSARLYRKAVELYKSNGGQLAKRDIANLSALAKSCEAMPQA